jgi:hypothetical protein
MQGFCCKPASPTTQLHWEPEFSGPDAFGYKDGGPKNWTQGLRPHALEFSQRREPQALGKKRVRSEEEEINTLYIFILFPANCLYGKRERWKERGMPGMECQEWRQLPCNSTSEGHANAFTFRSSVVSPKHTSSN